MRSLSLSLVLALALAALLAAPLLAVPDEKTTRWIGEVLLGGEFERKAVQVSRWTSSPSLSLIDAGPEATRLAKEVVTHLNKTLAGTRLRKIRLVAPGNYDARILVRFAPLHDLPRIANRHGVNYVEGNWGFFYAYRNGNSRITRALVLIASDKLEGDLMHHFLLEEITQCLGPMNDSPLFADSIFFSKSPRTGNPVELSERDRTLLRFLYNHVSPGAKPPELLAAIRQHWE